MSAAILVVDDDNDTLQLLEMVLNNAGYRVLLASDGGQALQRLARETPDLVLCDILMPVLDGLQTVIRIREDPRTRTMPVLMFSALGEERDVKQALAAGANGYVVKPFSLRKLLTEIKKYLPAPSSS